MSLLLLKIYSSSGVQRLGYEGSALHGSVKFEVPGGFQAPKGAPPPSWNEKRINSPRANFCVCHGRQNVLECYQITNKNIMYFCKLRMRTPLSREGILQIVKRPMPQTMFCRMISNCCGMPTLPPSKLSISNSVRKSVC